MSRKRQVPIAEGLFTWPSREPRLIGTECGECGVVTFPRQQGCPRCGREAMHERPLSRRGTLWTWTTQGFEPKPPYLPDGEFATMGFQVAHEAPPVGALIRHITANRKPPRPGDMYIGNDPYVGALHQNDVQMAGPVFDGDQLVAWAGVMAHETDVGGMDFASWSPKAKEIWQEGMRIPCVKLIDRGEMRDDVLEMIVTASRLPALLEAAPAGGWLAGDRRSAARSRAPPGDRSSRAGKLRQGWRGWRSRP